MRHATIFIYLFSAGLLCNLLALRAELDTHNIRSIPSDVICRNCLFSALNYVFCEVVPPTNVVLVNHNFSEFPRETESFDTRTFLDFASQIPLAIVANISSISTGLSFGGENFIVLNLPRVILPSSINQVKLSKKNI